VITPESSGTVQGLLHVVQIHTFLVNFEGVARIAIINSIVMVVPNAKYWSMGTQSLVERVHEGRIQPVMPPQRWDGRDVGLEE
jgi:hypothetical protein